MCIGSIPWLGVSVVQVHISEAAGSFPDMQELSVFPAEIIKMLALVVCISAWQKRNDEPNYKSFQRKKPYKRRFSMCEFCRHWHCANTICGEEIKINQYNKNILSSLTDAQILKNVNDKKAGIVLYSNDNMPVGYFDINYCPMCGRKLV